MLDVSARQSGNKLGVFFFFFSSLSGHRCPVVAELVRAAEGGGVGGGNWLD